MLQKKKKSQLEEKKKESDEEAPKSKLNPSKNDDEVMVSEKDHAKSMMTAMRYREQ